MKLISLFIISTVLASCSPSNSGNSARSKKKTSGNISETQLSKIEMEARATVQEDIAELQEGKYAMAEEDMQTLVDEGLLTEEELTALKIVQ